MLNLSQVGQRLKYLAGQVDLAMFEYWLTDVAGHHQDAQAAAGILQALDVIIGSLAESGDDDQCLVLVTSDHGNLEDMRTRHHTRNAVPLLLLGPKSLRHAFLEGMNGTCRSTPDLTNIAPALMRFID